QKTLIPLDETPGHETYRIVIHPDLYFDFTTLQGQTIEEDLSQRDFTINAMAVALSDFIEEQQNLIDPFNGQNDLRNQIIRVLPGRTFEDDPLRLLRAFRFASTLEFDIEPQTLAQIETHRTRLNEVAQERVTYELLLLFGAARSHIHRLHMTHLLEVLFPGITEYISSPGAQTHSTRFNDPLKTFAELENLLLRPEDYLEQHAQRIKDYISKQSRFALLKWSTLVRPLATASAFDTIDFLKKFRLSNSDIQFVHRTLKFSYILLTEASSAGGGFKEGPALYQFVHRSGHELISSLLLSLAVRMGNQGDIKYFIPLINRILDFYIKRYLPAQDGTVLLDGDDLQKKFQLKPSPRFKSILEKVEEARVLGTIHTKEEAEQFAKELITSQVELTE
ncbi:MAG: hypothetical protein OEM27_08775, partial [Nitrospinota bacterium]|nr:hypothetical protein [Nitrospinota bacterium]